jgi:hypothetical protein
MIGWAEGGVAVIALPLPLECNGTYREVELQWRQGKKAIARGMPSCKPRPSDPPTAAWAARPLRLPQRWTAGPFPADNDMHVFAVGLLARVSAAYPGAE